MQWMEYRTSPRILSGPAASSSTIFFRRTRLLAERPEMNCFTLAGLPQGSPGMGGPKVEPFTIISVAAGVSSRSMPLNNRSAAKPSAMRSTGGSYK